MTDKQTRSCDMRFKLELSGLEEICSKLSFRIWPPVPEMPHEG